MKNLTLQHIASACDGQYVGEETKKTAVIAGAVTDSRQVQRDYLFIPIKGERVDGHDFIPAVFEQGALATLSEHSLSDAPGPYILVESCQQALKDIAAYYRSQLTIPIVGITGSVGKTSTKEMIASVLSARYKVLKTAGNFNNEIGLPLTVLRIQPEHEAAVVEMGVSHFGDMDPLAEIARPDVCVITNIGACHLENLKDRDGVLKEKRRMLDYIQENGTIVLNGDDDKLVTVGKQGECSPIFYGMEHQDIYMDQVENLGLKGIKGKLHTPAGDVVVTVPIPGNHNLYNAMAAAGVGLALGLTLEEIKQGIETVETIGGRSNLIEAKGLLVIDDCYNANPMSMRASLDVLKFGLQRTIAVLGDMGELGENEKLLHYQVGEYAAQCGIDVLYCVGELSKEMQQGALDAHSNTQVFYFKTKEEMLKHLLEFVKEGDTILVKASHFMDFTKVVESLTR